MICPHPAWRGGHIDTASTGQPSAHPARQTGNEEKSPTGSFKFDNAVLEIGGFVDFENIFRTTNTATTSQLHSDPYRSVTRLRGRSRSFVPRHNTPGLT